MKKSSVYLVVIAALVLSGTAVYAEESHVEGNVNASVQVNSEKRLPPKPGFFEMIKNRIMNKEEGSTTKPEMRDNEEGDKFGSTTEMRGDDNEKGNRKGQDRLNASTTVKIKGELKSKIEAKIEKEREERGRGRMNQFTNMIERFDKTILRLQDILARLESRVAKIKAQGGVATTTDSFIVKTHTDIGLAQTSFLSLSALASSTVMTNSAHGTSTKIASSTLSQLQKLSDETSKHIRDAQMDMQKAISNLRGVKGEINSDTEVHATSTHN